ncbi:stalk domain-containing protein [Cohnella silvisoli]|uniref:Stalk domain-containing protein n=1 Tax=Cohnella silvisoli TaxID=2873699 RepID=A0ABV1KQ41_9BACL|nr:stalk domain-containing protein [Cohnella silvisoli]MCD9022225.1 copper amine oxidase N-terminal domain-containing protein [Cohnella silvisoli]
MQKKKLLILVTAVGLLGTTAAVSAGGLISKVNGVLHNEIAVSVNGTDTTLHPVYINGKAYLPARDTAAALGYNLNWNTAGKEIELTGQKEEAEKYIQSMGVVVSVNPLEKDGAYRIELLGKGEYSWIILIADKDTILTDESGQAFAVKDLKVGTRITAEFGPMVAMSFPGQSHAHKIVVGSESLVKEDVIQSIEKTDDGWQVRFGETKDGVATPTLVLNAGKETSVLTSQGESVDFASLKAGTKVTAYYGPIMTKSIPPQSPLHYLVVSAPIAGKLAPAAAQEYRELAWSNVPESEKSHLTTKKDEAQVSIIESKNAAIIAVTDAQKKKLAEIQAVNGPLIEVRYSTDQDALLGPLTMAFDPDTKMLVGFFQRM